MSTIRHLIRRGLLDPVRVALPVRRILGYDLFIGRLMNRLEAELVHLDRITRGGAVAVDIGANQGLYSYALSKRFQKVLAFEPNVGLADDLERHRPRNVAVHNVALSSAAGELELFIPLVNGVEQHGWASFNRENLPGARDFRILRVQVRPLDDFSLVGVGFVKIDVEGHELAVLQGAMDTLRRNRPTVLIEVKSVNREAVFDLFAELGYTAFQMHRSELIPVRREDARAEENYVFRGDPAH
jgi:FkbM family methyltransferase